MSEWVLVWMHQNSIKGNNRTACRCGWIETKSLEQLLAFISSGLHLLRSFNKLWHRLNYFFSLSICRNLIRLLLGRSSRCLRRLMICCTRESVKLSSKVCRMNVKSGLLDSLIYGTHTNIRSWLGAQCIVGRYIPSHWLLYLFRVTGSLGRSWYVLQMKDSSGTPHRPTCPCPLVADRAKRRRPMSEHSWVPEPRGTSCKRETIIRTLV